MFLVERLGPDGQSHPDAEVRWNAVDDGGHQPGPLLELDEGGYVRDAIGERRQVVDVDRGERVKRGTAAGRTGLDGATPAKRAEGPRVVVHPVAVRAVGDE